VKKRKIILHTVISDTPEDDVANVWHDTWGDEFAIEHGAFGSAYTSAEAEVKKLNRIQKRLSPAKKPSRNRDFNSCYSVHARLI